MRDILYGRHLKRWVVGHNLTRNIARENSRVRGHSEQNLTLFKCKPKEFLRGFATDETHTTGTKCSAESQDRPAGRKGDDRRFLGVRRSDLISAKLTGKGKEKTVTGFYCVRLFARSVAEFGKNTPPPPLGKENVVINHDNASAHTSSAPRRSRLGTAASSTLFSRIAPTRTLSVSCC